MEEKNPLLGVNPVLKSFLHLLTLIGLYLVFAVLSVFMGIQITAWVAGVTIPLDMTVIDYGNLDAHTIMGYKIFQAVASIGSFIVTALVFTRFFANEKLAPFFGFRGVFPPIKLLGLTVVIALSAIPVLSFILYLNQQLPLPIGMEEAAKKLQETNNGFNMAFLKAPSIGILFINLFVMAIIPAVGEELLFRGAFMQLFYRFFKENIHLAIVIVALLFAGMHLQYYSFFAMVFMGVIFGYIYYWSGNIMIAIWAHFINNGITISFAFLAEKNPDVEVLAMDYQYPALITAISALVLTGAIYLFYKTTKQYHPAEQIDENTEVE